MPMGSGGCFRTRSQGAKGKGAIDLGRYLRAGASPATAVSLLSGTLSMSRASLLNWAEPSTYANAQKQVGNLQHRLFKRGTLTYTCRIVVELQKQIDQYCGQPRRDTCLMTVHPQVAGGASRNLSASTNCFGTKRRVNMGDGAGANYVRAQPPRACPRNDVIALEIHRRCPLTANFSLFNHRVPH